MEHLRGARNQVREKRLMGYTAALREALEYQQLLIARSSELEALQNEAVHTTLKTMILKASCARRPLLHMSRGVQISHPCTCTCRIRSFAVQ